LLGVRCSTTTIDAGRSAGSAARMMFIAWIPPADAAIAINQGSTESDDFLPAI